MSHMRLFAFVAAAALLASAQADEPTFTPYNVDGTYAMKETVGWNVALPEGVDCLSYTVKTNGKETLAVGKVRPDKPVIETAYDAPAMLYVTVDACEGGKHIASLGAAVAPTEIPPVAERPADFDAFWARKVAELKAVPANPQVTPVAAPRPGVEEFAVTLNGRKSTVHAYLARPTDGKKHPALILFQYAGVYAIDPNWAAGRAAQGWLVLNVSSHDMPLDSSNGVPANYQAIGNTDRETSYFLEMYLRDIRALDYLKSLPDWDGKTLVVMGDSMGGQQSLAVAGLEPAGITAVLVNQPAGADTNAELHGRKAGYPNWAVTSDVLRSALYFDTVNFAPKITAPVLMSMGFIDTAVLPTGVWTAFNLITSPKEVVKLVDADHMHITPAPVAKYRTRANDVLDEILKTGAFQPRQ